MPPFWWSILESPVAIAIGFVLLLAIVEIAKAWLKYRLKAKKLDLRIKEIDLEKEKIRLQHEMTSHSQGEYFEPNCYQGYQKHR